MHAVNRPDGCLLKGNAVPTLLHKAGAGCRTMSQPPHSATGFNSRTGRGRFKTISNHGDTMPKATDTVNLRGALALAVMTILLIFSGRSSGLAEEAAPGLPPAGETRRTLLLLPFKNIAAIYGFSGNIRSPINGRVFLSGPVEDKAALFMDAKLHALLIEKEAFSLMASERGGDMVRALADRHSQPLPERDAWLEAGRALGADAVLGGFIYRFKDRTGRDYGVDEAASVAFDLHLIRVADGRIQWSGRFDETQQPLSNNLYNIKKFINRGGKWVTSREMATGGLKSMVANMPAR